MNPVTPHEPGRTGGTGCQPDAPTADTSQPLAATRSAPSLWRRLVLRAFAQMRRGGLRMELPDGSAHFFGEPGAHVTAVIRVQSAEFFKRCVLHGDIGFGEAFVDGDWDTDDLTAVIAWFITNVEAAPAMSGSRARPLMFNLLRAVNRAAHVLRPNSVATSRRNIREHYDLGNDFYALWLDPTMTYSSAHFVSPELTLEQAQVAKYDALCRKLRLKPADHVLEIGSGWGGFACHAVKTYGCRVTTLTISGAQFQFARGRFAREGVADRVEIRLQDYRHVTGRFDKIASIEMLEAVGDRYLETYFAKCHELLKRDGLLGLQYITCPDSRYDELRRGVDWIQKHIFPGSLLLSVGRVNVALNRTGDLFLHHLEDLGLSYARTLRTWREQFNARWPEVRARGFDERFARKWNYYLGYCEAAFAQRHITVVQAIYTRANNPTLGAG